MMVSEEVACNIEGEEERNTKNIHLHIYIYIYTLCCTERKSVMRLDGSYRKGGYGKSYGCVLRKYCGERFGINI